MIVCELSPLDVIFKLLHTYTVLCQTARATVTPRAEFVHATQKVTAFVCLAKSNAYLMQVRCKCYYQGIQCYERITLVSQREVCPAS